MGNTCWPKSKPNKLQSVIRTSSYSRNSNPLVVQDNRLSNRQSLYQITNPQDRTVYRGAINKNNLPHGKGQQTHEDGQMYEGQFREGVKQGKGIYKFSDGRFYEGDFVDNQMQGHGKMTWNNGDVYEGGFNVNQMEGFGVYKCKADGSEYRGNYKNGLKEGSGQLTIKGKSHKGNWQAGQFVK